MLKVKNVFFKKNIIEKCTKDWEKKLKRIKYSKKKKKKSTKNVSKAKKSRSDTKTKWC